MKTLISVPCSFKIYLWFFWKHNKGFPRIFEEYNHCSFKTEPRFFNKANKGNPWRSSHHITFFWKANKGFHLNLWIILPLHIFCIHIGFLWYDYSMRFLWCYPLFHLFIGIQGFLSLMLYHIRIFIFHFCLFGDSYKKGLRYFYPRPKIINH